MLRRRARQDRADEDGAPSGLDGGPDVGRGVGVRAAGRCREEFSGHTTRSAREPPAPLAAARVRLHVVVEDLAALGVEVQARPGHVALHEHHRHRPAVRGRVHRERVTTTPQGQGHRTVAAQVAADVLGLAPEQIDVRTDADTAANPWTVSSGNYSSRFAAVGRVAPCTSPPPGSRDRLRAIAARRAWLPLRRRSSSPRAWRACAATRSGRLAAPPRRRRALGPERAAPARPRRASR